MQKPDKPYEPGIYRIHWAGESVSVLGSVGINLAGKNWFAPTNWTYPSMIEIWDQIESLELSTTNKDISPSHNQKSDMEPSITEIVVDKLTRIADRAITKDDLQTALQATNLLKSLYENMANKLFPEA